jgi:2-polyprenyl-3-methyl-5-hydroxy-6-metoxy-1,4-benzoquinol methylase
MDYGGGFGTLARIIADQVNEVMVNIYEPHPSKMAQKLAQGYPNLHFTKAINKEYDCLLSIDVLEHCPDPLAVLSEMINAVRLNGFLIIANNFYPVIKCHLPCTFHLRYTFNLFTRAMGLRCIGACRESHAKIYQKVTDEKINWSKIRKLELLSKAFFPFLEKVHTTGKKLKRINIVLMLIE